MTKITINMPLIFEATLRRAKGQKTVAITDQVTFDAPDLSYSDAPVLFTAPCGHINAPSLSSYHDNFNHVRRMIEGGRNLEFRIYNDRIYIPAPNDHCNSEGGFRFHQLVYHCGSGIVDYFTEQQKAKSKGLLFNTYPAFDRRDDVRNRQNFTSIADRIKDIDQDSFHKCRMMQRRECEKLILIDGKPWIEIPRPCIAVDVESHLQANMNRAYKIRLGTYLLPEVHDQMVCRRYFPVTDMDAALEYTEELMQLGNGIHRFEIEHKTLEFSDDSSPLLQFDADDDYRDRLLTCLARNLYACSSLDKNSYSEAADKGDVRAQIFRDSLIDTKLLGITGTLRPRADEILDHSIKVGRLQSNQFFVSSSSRRFIHNVQDYAYEQIRGNEITLQVASHFKL